MRHYRAPRDQSRRASLRRPRRAPTRPPTPRGEGQHDRPRLAAAQGARLRVRAGLQRAGAVNEQQIVLAAEITIDSTDFWQLDPMVTATALRAERAGITELPEAVAADAGYWNEQHIDRSPPTAHPGADPARQRQAAAPPSPAGQRRRATRGCAACSRPSTASELYRKRTQTVEPLFGNTKHNSGFYRFHRRGRSRCATSGDY